MDFFGYQIAGDVLCEITGQLAQDIHHIDGRGKGKDTIENLIAITTEIHHATHFGKAPYSKAEFHAIHDRFILQNKRK